MELEQFNGPMFQLAMVAFAWVGFLKDTLFIRIAVGLGVVLVTAWSLMGVPKWPLWWDHDHGFALNALLWGGLQSVIVGIPLCMQLLSSDKRQVFPTEHEEEAEAMWRTWYYRVGVSRADFKDILGAGRWVQLQPGEELPVWTEREPQKGSAPAVIRCPTPFGNTYYYVFGGRLDCQTTCSGRPHASTASPGRFINGFPLLTLFGATPGALAIQDGPMLATVAVNSVYTPLAGSKLDTGTEQQGALVFMWRDQEIMHEVVRSGGFAGDAFRLMLTQAIMEEMYDRLLHLEDPAIGNTYTAVQGTRMANDIAPLPKDVAETSQRKSFWAQFVHSHGWPWHISPRERAVNAITYGSNVALRLHALRHNTSPYLEGLVEAEADEGRLLLWAKQALQQLPHLDTPAWLQRRPKWLPRWARFLARGAPEYSAPLMMDSRHGNQEP
mmetsp:Transcript_33132/g.93789  ORF Transcript_33132/g.93789 Transcript_33132/m.93789 type:complete len:440 (-) Transcript_33132:450-1769(-)|eukprot:CAMPEP_0117674450 /NCGR_PEP_ID=MMETSP0804-20121206/15045_1 /TAXON_ID=1074897 /ORGANISM="Tetraselmis astigmatica, Strain CCMP880" /LENGTH=439 /DNA_ID=CAMNT_0005483321 /DNA_START=475 /DNA_END=1794 /DNA_ORIENTATION=-